jgi:hypothetical protein
MVIAQCVVDELHLAAGRGHGADVAATPGGDTVSQGTDAGVRAESLDRLHRRPARQPGTPLGDPAALHQALQLTIRLGEDGWPAREGVDDSLLYNERRRTDWRVVQVHVRAPLGVRRADG